MNPENEKTLRNLGVLHALTQNDKLNTKDEIFIIYVPTTLRGITRFWYGETREHNIQKIQSCIRDAKLYISSTLNELNLIEKNSDGSVIKQLAVNTQSQLCLRMLSALKESETGLQSLQITYKDDATFTAQLDILLNEIHDFLTATSHIAQSSPTLDRFKCE
jgi:hypothetical protein